MKVLRYFLMILCTITPTLKLYSLEFELEEFEDKPRKIDVLKMLDLVPATASTSFAKLTLQDVYIQPVQETTTVAAHIDIVGKISLANLKLPGFDATALNNLTICGKVFSGFSRGAARDGSTPSTRTTSPALPSNSSTPPAPSTPSAPTLASNTPSAPSSNDNTAQKKTQGMLMQEKYPNYSEAFRRFKANSAQFKQFVETTKPELSTYEEYITQAKQTVIELQAIKEEFTKTGNITTPLPTVPTLPAEVKTYFASSSSTGTSNAPVTSAPTTQSTTPSSPTHVQQILQKLNAKFNALISSTRRHLGTVGATAKELIGGAFFSIILQNPNYKPFTKAQFPDLPAVDLPAIKDVEMQNVELGMLFAPQANTFSLFADGTARILNIPSRARALFNYEKDNTGIVLQAGLPETWKISDSFPELKAFDALEIKRAYLYLSTIRYVDYSIPTTIIPSSSSVTISGKPTLGTLPGIEIRPGISLYGEINLKKLMPDLIQEAKVLGLETVAVYGTISHKPENWLLGTGLPDIIKIPKGPYKLGGVWLEIRGTPAGQGAVPDVAAVIAIVIQPSTQDEQLTFTTRITAGTTVGHVAFSMQGFWRNALGIQGLSVGDLAIQLDADYKLLLSTGLPSGAGFTGTIQLGTQPDSKHIKVASLMSVNSQGSQVMVLSGKFDGSVTVKDLISTAQSLSLNALDQAVRNRKVTTTAATINKEFDKVFNSPVAKALLSTGFSDVEVKVAPETVRIGEFAVLQGFTMRGNTNLLGVKTGVNFNISQSGITGEGYVSPITIGNVFKLSGAGMDKQYGTPDDAALISLALNFVKQHCIITGQVELLGLKQQTDIFVDADGINCNLTGKLYNLLDANVQLKSRGSLDKPDLYFKATLQNNALNFITQELSKQITATASQAINQLEQPKRELDKLNTDISSLEQQISERKKRIEQLGGNFVEGLKNSPEITKLGLEITGLETARAGAIASREVAQGALTAVQRSLGDMALIATHLLDLKQALTADVRSVTLEASLQDLAHGKFPRYTSTIMVLGRKLNIDMQLDFSTPERAQESISAIAKNVLENLKKVL